MYRVVFVGEIVEYETAADLKRAFGERSEYVPDCGTRGDILIRHPLDPNRPIRAVYHD